MYKIVLLPLAADDIRAATQWYAEKGSNLGERFKNEVSSQIDNLKDDVIERAPVYQELSRVFIKKFPYVIYYQKQSSAGVIIVFAVLHQ